MSIYNDPDRNDGGCRDRALEQPNFMATDSYARSCPELFEEYSEMRVAGTHPSIAFRRVWGEDFWCSHSQARIYAVEANEMYTTLFRQKLLNTPINKLWNERLAVHKLLSLAHNVFEKGSTQLRAVQELNVLVGITIVDENGKTRKGSKMSDFYQDIGTEHMRGRSDEPK